VRDLRRPWRTAVAALALLAGLTAGCDEDSAADPVGGWPIGAAGRACQLLEYATVEAALGTAFDTAGGATSESTYTCVLTVGGQDYPDLTLAVSPSSIDELIFTTTVNPSNSVPVAELGRIAYSLQRPAADGQGPGVEVGWLSASGRLLMLRYTFAADAPAEAVAALTAKLVAFAQQIDAALPTVELG
jgi:hypothetical protein